MKNSFLIGANQAILGLESNKVRTALTMLGIIIGIAVVIIVISAGNGAKLWIEEQLEQFGTNTIFTEVQVPSSRSEAESGFAVGSGVSITSLKQKDADDTEKIPGVAATYAVSMGQEKIIYSNKEKRTSLFGTNASYPSVDKSQVAEGRFFTDDEEDSLSSVIVLGADLKKLLFGETESALNKFVRIKGQNYRVVGVMKGVGARFTLNMDEYAFIPLKTLQKKILGTDYVVYFVTKVQNESQVEFVSQQMESVLRKNHDIHDGTGDKDDFLISTSNETAATVNTVLGGVTLLLSVIAGISLLVGGIGIMNIMFVTVTERTKEIGLRKALGARRSHILLQFLFEAVLITVIGGAIGLALGVLISSVIASIAQSLNFNWPLVISWDSIILAIGTSSAFGLVFGIVPARQAAALDPVESLRFEY